MRWSSKLVEGPTQRGARRRSRRGEELSQGLDTQRHPGSLRREHTLQAFGLLTFQTVGQQADTFSPSPFNARAVKATFQSFTAGGGGTRNATSCSARLSLLHLALHEQIDPPRRTCGRESLPDRLHARSTKANRRDRGDLSCSCMKLMTTPRAE